MMTTETKPLASGEAAVEELSTGINCLPASVLFSFIVMGLCIVLGGTLLI